MPVDIVKFPSFIDKLTLSAQQAAFLRSRAKKKILNCGRFGGKTMWALVDVLNRALELFAARVINGDWWRPGAIVTVGIFTPTEKNQKQLWPMLCDMVPKVPGETDGVPNTHIRQDAKEIVLFGQLGIQIDVVSAWNPDAIRGAGYDIVLIDEAAYLKQPNIYHRQILPLVNRAGFEGIIILASTPLNNFWDKWVLSAREKTGRFKYFEVHEWSCWENPALSKDQEEEILAAREENRAIYEQEYEGKLFVEIPNEEVIQGEAVWDISRIEEVLIQELPVKKLVGPFVAGLDLAWQGTDDLVLTIADEPTGVICHIESFPKMDDPAIYALMDRVRRQWNDPVIWVDRTGSRAKAFWDHIPPAIRAKPVILRRGIERAAITEQLFTKDFLVRSLEQRMTLGKIKIPDPAGFPWETLPWSNQCDQQAEFQQLYNQMVAIRRVTVKFASGNIEYRYRPDPSLGKNRKYRCADDYFDSLLLVNKGLPLIETEHISLEELNEGIMANW